MTRLSRWWGLLPLHWKVMAAVAAPSLALVMTLLGAIYMDREKNEASQWVKRSFEVRSELDRAELHAARIHAAGSRYLITGNAGSKDNAYEELDKLQASFEHLRSSVSEDRGQMQRLQKADAAREELSRVVHQLFAPGQVPGGDLTPFRDRLRAARDVVTERLQRMLEAESNLLAEREARAGEVDRRVHLLMFFCVLSGLGGGAFSTLVLTRSIVGRVLGLEDNVRRLELGMPLKHIAGDPDELGRLSLGLERASELLRERSCAFENALDGIARFDEHGIATTANRAFAAMLGRDLDQVVGHLRGFAVTADDLPEYLASYGRMRETGKAETFVRMVKPDGGITFQQATLVRITGKNGEFRGHYTFLKDLTARVQAEEALRAAHARLESVLAASTQVAIISMTSEGVIEFVNPGVLRMLGYGEAALVGKPVLMLHVPAEIEARAAELSEAEKRAVSGFDVLTLHLGRDGFEEREWTYLRQDGTPVIVSVTMTIATDHEDRPTGYLGVAIDITQRKLGELRLQRAKEEAEAANEAKSEFLARMSHEIRTPMNAILGMADLLWETELSRPQREYVRIFRAGADRLIGVINDILDLSKIEAGRLSFESVPFSLREAVVQPVDLFASKAAQRGVRLGYRIDPAIPDDLLGDAQRLQQVLMNLLGNAVKFTERGAIELEIVLEEESDTTARLRFAVLDSGPGIAPEKLENIFEPFVQADTSITRKHGGTGLGLAISRKIVEMMGGRIWVESELGEGSAFYFTARLERQSPTVRPRPAEPMEVEGLNALIVDDDATNRMMLREALLRWGIQPVCASDADSALNELRKAEARGAGFDIVLLDRHLGASSGFELAERMKAGLAQTPAIALLTSDRNPGDLTRAHALGIRSVLEKPFERTRLLDRIEEAIRYHRREEWHAAPLEEAEEGEGKTARVLLAEDSEANAMLIRAYLSLEALELDVVENGRQAVEQFKAKRYDLVFMDVQMPEMDGHTASAEIREWERGCGRPPTPIIALTAHALENEISKSMEAGCSAHLTKPIRRKTVVEMLHRWLDRNKQASGHTAKG